MTKEKEKKEEPKKGAQEPVILEDVLPQDEWKEKAAEYLNDLKRTQADFDNYKKRLAKDREELGQFMVKSVVSDLIPILDNFHQAVSHVPEAEKKSPWVTGITYIEKQFEDVLANYGVEPLKVKPGDPFDPTEHEALEHKAEAESPDPVEGKENNKKLMIEKVIQKGYKLGDKVVRAAKVTVK